MNARRDTFAALHKPGHPVLLYNIWDVGSARAVAAAGAPALATGSHPLANANGFPDGEQIPFNLFLDCVRRIVHGVEVPVSADFEGGFAVDAGRRANDGQGTPAISARCADAEHQVIGVAQYRTAV